MFMAACVMVSGMSTFATEATQNTQTTKSEAEQTVIAKNVTEVYYSLEQDVYLPENMTQGKKYPVVFFAHNGFADKLAWGDFPEQVSKAGFIAVNITWKDWDTSNIERAIAHTLEKYSDKIDTKKVSFVGGCHGAKDFLQIMSKDDLTYTITTAVLLAPSEDDQAIIDTQKVAHPPILEYYSKNDELGAEYQKVINRVANEIITQPKTVIALDETAHGNDIVTKAAKKDEVRANIIEWLKKYNK